MDLGELWTGILDTIAQIIIPVWNDLIEYLPLLIVFGIFAVLGGLAWMWQRNAAGNRSRVPRPIPAGRKPEDMHLPGPSLWPFVAPAGLLFIVFAVALGPFESLAQHGPAAARRRPSPWSASSAGTSTPTRNTSQVEAGGHGARGGDRASHPAGR